MFIAGSSFPYGAAVTASTEADPYGMTNKKNRQRQELKTTAKP
jgi:hypothetical protein